MHRVGSFISLIFSPFILSACSHEIDLAYYCMPSGATIYEEGIGIVGICPVTLKYNSYDIKVSKDVLYTNKIHVIWASGASILVPPMAVDIPPDRKASLTFTRPENFPNYEKDRNFSANFEEGVLTPAVKYVVSPNQDADIFDTINKSVSCAFDGVIRAVGAQCP
jgi:hypothetical protein